MERRSYIWARLLSNVDTPEIMTACNKRSTSKKAAAARRQAAANKDQVPEEANIQELLKRLVEQQTMIEQLTHVQAAEDSSKPLSDVESELMLPPCLVATCMILVDVADIANDIGREALTENHGSPNVPLAESTVARPASEKPAGPNSKLMERWDKRKWLTVRV